MAPRKKTTRRTAAKKTTARKTAARKTAARKTAARKPAAKKRTTARKTTARKAPARKTAARKAPARKAPARKTAARKAPAHKAATGPISDAYKKSEILNYLADATELSRKQVSTVFESLNELIERHLKKRAAGEFTLPGICKYRVVRKPATKARKGINPFTGEEIMFKAKPARNVVKIRPLKKLKEMVE